MNKLHWFQRVKDKEFESNSQQMTLIKVKPKTGFSVSKIKNLKAIHNNPDLQGIGDATGFSVSKIKNLKAIHNRPRL